MELMKTRSTIWMSAYVVLLMNVLILHAIFSFALWPYSMKLLWAPLVDSLYVRRLGRRKSWLIPVQFSLGILLLVSGFSINEQLMNVKKPNVVSLAVMFFILNLLVATQDIVVDGWALTMLKRENIGYAAMCNCAGLSFGVYLGFTFLIMLMSETFWNNWRSSPQPGGIISLQGYLHFWGLMCMVITTLVAIFKTEKDHVTNTSAEIQLSIVNTYKLLLRIMTLPSIKMLAIIVLSVNISYSPITAAFKLKLIDGGITKDQIATIEFLYTPLRICLPILITKYTSKEEPFKSYFNAIPYRLLVGVVLTLVVFFTPMFLTKTGPLLIAYKICLVLIYFSEMIMEAIMIQTLVAFFTKISDPKIGGTIMTLLNTIRSIGISGSETFALWLIDMLTFKNCSNNYTNTCLSADDQNSCGSSGGTCKVRIDGFYVETAASTIYGVVWCCIFKKYVDNLQSKNVKEWQVETKIKEQS